MQDGIIPKITAHFLLMLQSLTLSILMDIHLYWLPFGCARRMEISSQLDRST
jgi:hypothetical protein